MNNTRGALKTKASSSVYYGTGRRKTSIAKVRILPGTGNITINKKPFVEYFPRETARMIVRQPLEVTKSQEKFDVIATVVGGGSSGQAGAVRLGISRAIVKYDEDENSQTREMKVEIAEGEAPALPARKLLRKAELLTRDYRSVERKKVGRHKARKGPQFSKR